MNNQSESSQFSENYKETSYWLDDISSFDPKNEQWPELPEQTDLVIIGSGYTGLNAAIETAAQGVETLVIDQGDLGKVVVLKTAAKSVPASNPLSRPYQRSTEAKKQTPFVKKGLTLLIGSKTLSLSKTWIVSSQDAVVFTERIRPANMSKCARLSTS